MMTTPTHHEGDDVGSLGSELQYAVMVLQDGGDEEMLVCQTTALAYVTLNAECLMLVSLST
jgi:hypothetical protein